MPVALAFNHFIPLLLIMARLSGFIAFAPVFDSSAIPARIKLSLVLVLSGVFHFGFGLGLGAEVPLDSVWPLVGLLIKEFATGTVMSMTMLFIFSAFSYAGSLIAPQMGLAVSQLLDPQTQSMQPLLGTFLGMIGGDVFISHRRPSADDPGLCPKLRAGSTGRAFRGQRAFGAKPLGQRRAVIRAGLQDLRADSGRGDFPKRRHGHHGPRRAAGQRLVVGFIITISVGFIVLVMVLPQMGPSFRSLLHEMIERARFGP